MQKYSQRKKAMVISKWEKVGKCRAEDRKQQTCRMNMCRDQMYIMGTIGSKIVMHMGFMTNDLDLYCFGTKK